MNPTHHPPSRREFLRVGAIGAGSLTLANVFDLLNRAPLAHGRIVKPRVSMILIWLDGGPSHIDMFDPKPKAGAEIRGNWDAVSTPIPGVQVGRGMEQIAEMLTKCSLIRSLNSDAGEHDIARHLLLTGFPQTPSLEYPNFGSVIAKLSDSGDFPPYLYISPFLRGSKQLGAGFLSAENNPFAIEGDPNRPYFSVRDLKPPAGIDDAAIRRRFELSQGFDTFKKTVESSPAVRAHSTAFERAYRLVSSEKTRAAFDISKEPDAVRDRYGRNVFGQSLLLARRLVEAGAGFVTVNDGSWDTHAKCQEHLAVHRIPKVDRALPALIEDLETRGMINDVAILMMGEFGRTPKINVNEGRDHWPGAGFALFAGGGIKKGVVVGATDERAEQVVERPVSPQDVAATIYTLLGIDPKAEIRTPDGRPIELVKDGNAVKEILTS